MGGREVHSPQARSGEPVRLCAIAAGIADHIELDWGAVGLSSGSERRRSEVRALRLIDAVSRFHRELQSLPEPALLPPGRLLGDFRIVSEIGRGGMGVVYEAEQVSLGRRVALKILPPLVALSNASVERFRREAQAAALLSHANIVEIHATGDAAGCPFYVMELVDGPSLKAVLDDLRAGRRDLPADTPLGAPGAVVGSRKWFETVAHLVEGIARGLQYAHSRAVVHRDVKPANLLFDRDGNLRLTDFGLARILEEPATTVSGAVLGTPAYMSLEQVGGAPDRLDHRTDIYSLGAVLYEMLTLARPFPQDAREALARAILEDEPAAPRRLQPTVPRDLESICLKALEKEPGRRYATAAALAEDLQRYLRHEPTAAHPVRLPRRAARSARRHPQLHLLAAAGVLLVAMALATWRSGQLRIAEGAHHAVLEAQRRFEQGDYRESVTRADRALALDPHLADALFLRGRALAALGEPEGAAADAGALLAEDPRDWRGHLVLASLAGRTSRPSGRDLATARVHAAAIEAGAPNTPDALYARALATPDAIDAIALLDRALQLDPAHGGALAERLLRQIARDDVGAALQDCERLIAATPRSALGYAWKGRIQLERLHDVAAAGESLRRALATDPRDASARELAESLRRAEWQPRTSEAGTSPR